MIAHVLAALLATQAPAPASEAPPASAPGPAPAAPVEAIGLAIGLAAEWRF